MSTGRSSVSFKTGDFVTDGYGWVMILGNDNENAGSSKCFCATDPDNRLYQNPNSTYFFKKHASSSDKKRLLRVLAKHGYSYQNGELINEF